MIHMTRREKTIAAIVDAAELLLRKGGTPALTAGAVADQVGLARNSLYRYVDSVDELRAMVVARHLPVRFESIMREVDSYGSPREALVAYTSINLEIAHESDHAFLMSLAEGLSGEAAQSIGLLHNELNRRMFNICQELDPEGAKLTLDLVNGIIAVGFDAFERGDSLEEVLPRCVEAVTALVDARAAQAM